MDSLPERSLQVVLPEELAGRMMDRTAVPALIEVLSLDPRPSYHDDPDRVYGISFAGNNVLFKVEDGTLTVVGIE